MQRLLKIMLVCLGFLNSFFVSAQHSAYLSSENERISNARQTEAEIESFINDNYDRYELSIAFTDAMINELRNHEKVSDVDLKQAFLNAKREELRKLFFVTYPDKKDHYIAQPIPNSISQVCVNGDFESNAAGYTFWTDLHPQPASGTAFFQSCATPTAQTLTNVLTPTTNNFNSRATIISSTGAGYQQFDPVLTTFGVNLPTLNTNGGTKCIKLNNTQGLGSSDLTTVSRSFPVINEATIDFNFSLVMDNKVSHGQGIQPYFRARALDQAGNVVDEICIVADPENCLFNIINVDADRRVLYTGWLCARLNVGEILNQPGTIQFSVSDCQPSAHFGTVYIDNICGLTCAAPQLGALSIDPVNFNCPDVIHNVPMEVCGTYQPPANATLNTIILNITQNGSVVGTVNVPSQLTASSFCFSVLPGLFGTNPSGNFEFEVVATFNVSCQAGTFLYNITDDSAAIGPDVTFIDCCLPTLTLVSPTNNHNNLAPIAICQRQRSDWIKATNVISFGNNALANGVVYHAANFVELNPGFEAVTGSQFAAYPEGCSANYVYRTPTETPHQPTPEPIDVRLIKKTDGFSIIPNPSGSTVELTMKNATFHKITITTIDGKMVYETAIDHRDKFKMDVSSYANGVYLVTIMADDGKQFTEKLIKN